MTFDPQHFLNLAKRLVDDPNYDEGARYRSAISRAYYAAHLVSKKRLEDIGLAFPIESDKNIGVIHEMIISAWIRKNGPVAHLLKSLRKNRNLADYDLNRQFTKYGTQLLLSKAETIIFEANRLKK